MVDDALKDGLILQQICIGGLYHLLRVQLQLMIVSIQTARLYITYEPWELK
jgi:hypothetical protein